ncbi:MAG: hypothetical protein ABFR33_11605 [Verrucomicrobiota bacterium]
MKTGTKTAAIFTALLAGTVATVAHPHPQGHGQRQQQGRQGSPQFQGQRQGCPVCGNPNFRPQGHGSHRRGQGACGPQFQNDGPPPQFRQDRQGQRKPNPQQREQIRKKRRQAILERFDADDDGTLSKEERQAVRQAMKERRQGKGRQNRPDIPPSE